MSVRAPNRRHSPRCCCEACMRPLVEAMAEQSNGTRAVPERIDPEPDVRLPTTVAEYQAALDRAYGRGVERGREYGRKER